MPDQPEIPLSAHYQPLTLATGRGEVRCRFYAEPDAVHGIICVGGVGGGWDSPARDLYHRLSVELAAEAFGALRIRFRYPGDLEECVFDVLAGARLLETRGISRIGLVGHSFGGAVVIRAAALLPAALAVATLATQGAGTEPAATLGPRCGLLLIHGRDDEVLPPLCSERVHARAAEPKRLLILNGARHVLDEVADRVHREVRDWMLSRLAHPLER